MKKKIIPSKTLHYFRKWTRRKDGAFLSIGRQIKICVLWSAYSLITQNAEAQDKKIVIPEKDTLEIDEVVVSGQISPELYSGISRVVEVISLQEIQSIPAKSLGEFLEHNGGLDVRQRGPGAQADLSIRGGHFDQTLILLNGIPQNDPQTGHHNLNLPIDLSSVYKIEILKGPSSRIFGKNAFTGAVNIITRPADKNSLNFSTYYGAHGYHKLSLGANLKIKNSKHLLSVSKKGSRGYMENTDYSTSNIFYQGEKDLAGGIMEWQGAYTQKAFGANAFYTPVYPNQFEETGTLFGSVSYKTGGKVKTRSSVFFRRHSDRFELFRSDPPEWYSGPNHHINYVYGGRSMLGFDFAGGKSSIGFDIQQESIRSNVLGEIGEEYIKDGVLYDHQYQRPVLNAFLEQSMVGERFSASGGFLFLFLPRQAYWSVSPGIDVSWKLRRTFKVYATINHSVRVPTFTDLFYEGPINVGNPDLLPEEALSFETGIKYTHRNLSGNLSVYTRKGNNIIDWVKESPDEKWQSRNITALYSWGLESSNDIRMHQSDKLYRYVRSLSFSYYYIDQYKASGNFISKYALDYLRHKVSLKAEHYVAKNVFFTWTYSWQDRAGRYSFYEDGAYRGETEYPAFCLMDLRFSWRPSRFKVYLDISNVFDRKYMDIGNLLQPGRWIIGGIEVALDRKK